MKKILIYAIILVMGPATGDRYRLKKVIERRER